MSTEQESDLEQLLADTTPQTFDFGDGNGPVPARRHTNPARNNTTGNVGGWVACSAYVAPTATVGPMATVYGKGSVYGKAKVLGQASVYGSGTLSDNAEIRDYAQVYGTANVEGQATVSYKAKVYGNAHVKGCASITSTAEVLGSCMICDQARINDRAKISQGYIGGQTYCGEDFQLDQEFGITGCGALYHPVTMQPIVIQGFPWTITIEDEYMNIGCQQFKFNDWWHFKPSTISSMHHRATEFWSLNKEWLFKIIINQRGFAPLPIPATEE